MNRFFLFFILVFVSCFSRAKSCDFLFRPIAGKFVTLALENNTFNNFRDLLTYRQRLSPSSNSFAQVLSQMPVNSIYMDMGTGSSKALFDILRSPVYSQISQVVGIAYKKPTSVDPQVLAGGFQNRFRFHDGDYVERMHSNGVLDRYRQSVHLISDLYGPLSYSNDIQQLLGIYWDLLRPGGDLFFTLQLNARYDGVDVVNLEFIDPRGRKYMNAIDVLRNWLLSMPGYEVREIEEFVHHDPDKSTDSFERGIAIHLRKTTDGFQPLEMSWKFTSSQTPTRRVYQVDVPAPVSKMRWSLEHEQK